MSVLEDLYSGKIYPLENIVSHNLAYRFTNEKMEPRSFPNALLSGKIKPPEKFLPESPQLSSFVV